MSEDYQTNPTNNLFKDMFSWDSYDIFNILQLALYELSNVNYKIIRKTCNYHYYSNSVISIRLSENILPNKDENINKFKKMSMFSYKKINWADINIYELQQLAIDYIFNTYFDYFYNEGYIKCWNYEYNDMVMRWKEYNEEEYTRFSNLDFETLKICTPEWSQDNSYYILKHYKKYLNGPLIEFLQLIARSCNNGECGHIQDCEMFLIPSIAIRQAFKNHMTNKLGYELQYDNNNEYDLYYSAPACFNQDYPEQYRYIHSRNLNYQLNLNASIPVKISLNHYKCKFGNNIAIEFGMCTEDNNANCFWYIGVDFTCISKYIDEEIYKSIIPIEYNRYLPREENTHELFDLKYGYIRMNWENGDKWTCIIPFAPRTKNITYKFVELDENNNKLREESQYTNLNIGCANKFSNFQTSRCWCD